MKKAKRLIVLLTAGLALITGTLAGCGKKDGAGDEGRKTVQVNNTKNQMDGENSPERWALMI